MTNYCLLCEQESEFGPFGAGPPRERARCTNCDSLERDRFSWLIIKGILDLCDCPSDIRYLNIGVDKPLTDKLRPILKQNLVTVGLENGVDIQANLTNLIFKDKSFDIIYCSHVLEHIKDDMTAMREMARVLSDKGIAIIIVPPLRAEEMLECLDDIPKDERARLFGHWDHWRAYGKDDFQKRLFECGLDSEMITIRNLRMSDSEFERLGITEKACFLFKCSKREK